MCHVYGEPLDTITKWSEEQSDRIIQEIIQAHADGIPKPFAVGSKCLAWDVMLDWATDADSILGEMIAAKLKAIGFEVVIIGTSTEGQPILRYALLAK